MHLNKKALWQYSENHDSAIKFGIEFVVFEQNLNTWYAHFSRTGISVGKKCAKVRKIQARNHPRTKYKWLIINKKFENRSPTKKIACKKCASRIFQQIKF
jgi:DNA-directed RNA polymerase subunit RPC12/RpoP